MSWDVFVSHASEDKKAVAEPLSAALGKVGVSVWLDRFELRLGDRLRKSIENGLRESRFGVVVLSAAFFAKDWPQMELDAMAQLEVQGRKVILPIWYDVSAEDVRLRSLLLADRLAVVWSAGLDNVVAAILAVVRSREPSDPISEDALLASLLRLRHRTRFLWQEIFQHLADRGSFAARVRHETLKAIEEDLIKLQRHGDIEYETAYLAFDYELGDHVSTVTVLRASPRFWNAVVRTIALEQS